MGKYLSRKESLRRATSIRGLNPTTVMMIAVLVMICGFVVSSREESRPEPGTETAELGPAAESKLAPPFDPIREREELLGDKEAVYRATLWLARCVYSETDRRHEQELVAWVVRNRVETNYREESAYSRVVMDPFQFSAFNRRSRARDFLLTLDTTYAAPRWQQAIGVARSVILADPSERPFPITTRHFYSERSLGDYEVPIWSLEEEPISVGAYEIDEKRFRFYDRVF